MKFNLFDSSFAHSESSVAGKQSKYIEWIRGPFQQELDSFYTHEKALSEKTIPDKSSALFIESYEYIPHIYRELRRCLHKFKTVFTSNSYLLETYPDKCKFSPSGGIWVGGTQGLGEIMIYPKTKLCSIVCGKKIMCSRHEMRLTLAQLLTVTNKVDIMGDINGPMIPIIDSLKDYHYSIIIENHIDKWYFTEKTLNCFATGTVPILSGPTDLGRFFNLDGIIQFTTIDECLSIINKLNTDFYYQHISAIQDNFERCKQYEVIEDYIYSTYLL